MKYLLLLIILLFSCQLYEEDNLKRFLIDNLSATINASYETISKETDTEIAIRIDDRVMVIDFEGSISVKDWLKNFEFGFSTYDQNNIKIKAHAGIISKWVSVEDYIKNNIIVYNPKKIILRGFSQGGAMAVFGNAVLSRLYFGRNVVTYAFGAPHVFHKSTDDLKYVYLYELSRDIVCHVPPAVLGYKKIGERFVIDRNRPWWDYLTHWYNEHSPSSYIKEIEKRL